MKVTARIRPPLPAPFAGPTWSALRINRTSFLHRRRAVASSFLACAIWAGVGFAASARAKDWPNFRGPDHTGISAETDWKAEWPDGKANVLWSAKVNTGFSSIAIAGGRAFTMGNQAGKDTVFALDAKTGKELWRHPYDCPLDPNLYEGGPNATPTVDGDQVYTLSKRGHLFCFQVADGKIVWQTNLTTDHGAAMPEWGFAGSPLVLEEKLVLNAGSAGMALDKATGKVLWQSGKGQSGYATPVPFTRNSRTLVAIFGMKHLFAVDTADGTPLWSLEWHTDYDVNAADPIVSGDLIFVSSAYNKGCSVWRMGRGTPQKVWANRKMRNQMNSTVLHDGFLYGFDESTLRCLEFATGNVTWSQGGLGKASLIMAGGRLVVLSEKGELVIAPASPDGFVPTARSRVLTGKCWTPPAFADGRIYARNAAGTLVCVDVGAQP